jgi:predicted polyphosphate/ATP-dependent NAD kinase
MPVLLGLLVNPVAGMGGRVGLHGTDGPLRLAEAQRRGAASVTAPRAQRALRRLAGRDPAGHDLPGHDTPGRAFAVLAAPGPMGAEVAAASGVVAGTLDLELGPETTAADTGRAARMLVDAGAALLLFAGGDGTAADIVRAVDQQVPILGIPSGVKMRSGVFASSPEAAGELAADFLARDDRPVATAEVLDAAELDAAELGAAELEAVKLGVGPASLRPGAVEFLGLAIVPSLGGGRLPGAKTSDLLASSTLLDAACRSVADELVPGTLYLFGPGSTTGRILEILGLPSSPLGVDAVRDGALVGMDLGEEGIVELMEQSPSTKLVLGVIGGQGFLLGRGNQQLGPPVLVRLAAEDLIIVSAAEKIVALQPPLLRVDIGDDASFPWATGYRRVRVGPSRFMVMRVSGPA